MLEGGYDKIADWLIEAKLRTRNEAYYTKYPEDIEKVKRLAAYLAAENVKLPSGGSFSVLRLRQLGIYFGFHGTPFNGWCEPYWIFSRRLHGQRTWSVQARNQVNMFADLSRHHPPLL